MGDRVWSYGDLERAAEACAAGLRTRSIGSADRVALHLGSGWELIVAYYGCFKAGAIAVPVNPRFVSREIQHVLRHSGAKAYIGRPDLFTCLEARPPQVEHWFITGDAPAPENAERFDDLLSPAPPQEPAKDVSAESVAALLYTSGTTAQPKGVIHTHRSLGAIGTALTTFAFQPEDLFLNALPLGHMAGFSSLLGCIAAGCATVILPFEAEAVLEAIECHRATVVSLVPSMCQMVAAAQRANRRDTRSVRSWFTGGDAVSTSLQETFRELFGQPLCEVYGLTEVAPVTWNPLRRIRTGSLGQPVDGVALRIVDEGGQPVRQGEQGEIEVGAAGMTSGYWNDADATTEAFHDGWLRTGDLGLQDADGYSWFRGRKKDIIVSGGFKVSPPEVEDILRFHPAVAEAGVVGVPDQRWGEAVAAFVVLRPGMSAEPAELTEFVRHWLSRYKAPKEVVFVDELPKNAAGKVRRRDLREQLLTQSAAAVSQ
jgi:long-chain acyl-CoA synthetase